MEKEWKSGEAIWHMKQAELNALDVAAMNKLNEIVDVARLRQRVAELEMERVDCGKLGLDLCEQFKQLTAERDALKQQRDELLAAIKKFLDENNPEGFGCACEPDRLCGPCSEAKRQRPLYAAIATVKEKQNAAD